MKKGSTGDVTLSVEAEETFLPLVTAVVEKSAQCFGLGEAESLMLTLAAEEVFMHLCRVVLPSSGPVEVRCSNGGYYTLAEFSFKGDSFDMRALNISTTISIEDDADLEGMGLVIASRSVDRFYLTREKGHGLRLSLVKKKCYPTPAGDRFLTAHPLPSFSLRSPGPEEAKYISQLAANYYKGLELAEILVYPGELADMIKSGEYQSMAAVGPAGEIGGAVFWHWIGQKVVECFGPYAFNQDPKSAVSEKLLESCIGAVARTRAVGIINTRPTPEFSRRHFELLGTIDIYGQEGSCTAVEAWFRLLHEDAGSAVWVHPELHEFLRREYARLVLPREIRIDQPSGESLPRHSVLSAEFDRLKGRVTLRPMWPGADVEENVESHVKLLLEEKILNIHFAVDLGQAWHSGFIPGLLKGGFEPRFVMPYAGDGDVVVFQYRGQCA